MTLVLLWKNDAELVVIADTQFMAQGRPGLSAGPKIFLVPLRISRFGTNNETQVFPDLGFAFAGFTMAGQITHAIASAGLQNLVGSDEATCPSIGEVADYFARCATFVVDEMRRIAPGPSYLFEGVVFGWEGSEAIAYSFEVGIDSESRAASSTRLLDFAKSGLYAIGQGHEKVQAYIDSTAAEGRRASPYDALLSVIKDVSVPGVGGSVQAAVTSNRGTELKAVLIVDQTGAATGGFMGADMARLGRVGSFVPLGGRPVVLAAKLEDPSPLKTPSGL